MKKVVLLRVAVGLLIFHLIGHSFGNATWDETDDTAKKIVIQEMVGKKFPFMGAERSMGEYYYGYGLITSVFLVYTSLLLFILSFYISKDKSLSLNLIWLSAVSTLSMSLIELIYFFPLATVTTLLSAICIIFAGIITKLEKE